MRLAPHRSHMVPRGEVHRALVPLRVPQWQEGPPPLRRIRPLQELLLLLYLYHLIMQIYHNQNSEINRENGRLTSYDCFTIEKEYDEPKVLKDEFTLQIYTAKELRKILVRNRFEVLGQYEINGSKLLEQETINMLTVAKRS